MAASATTTDHAKIKEWTRSRNGIATTISEGDNDILRIHFPEASADEDETFDEASWEDFFKIFEDRKLAFLHSTDKDSTFNKFVDR